MSLKIAVVIKTHDDHKVIDPCVAALKRQSAPADRILIMDSGSRDPAYLAQYLADQSLEVIIEEKDVGFCAGNNRAARRCIDGSDFILFLNPDAFLPEPFLADLSECIRGLGGEKLGVIGPKLWRYDLAGRTPTRILDTTGIFRNWHGRWYDRGQGEVDHGRYDGSAPEPVPAICGAAMICGAEALKASQLKEGEYFREDFFLYKDDIELSLRIRRHGYRVLYASQLTACHCRGWQSRRNTPRKYRVMSARNELVVNGQIGGLPRAYSTLKYWAARLGL